MAIVYEDRVKETSTTTGTGTYTLAGAVTGFQAFSAIGDGNVCCYCAEDGTDWEVGLGTYTLSGTTLARTEIISSSNSDAAVNWTAGTRNLFVTQPGRAFMGSGAMQPTGEYFASPCTASTGAAGYFSASSTCCWSVPVFQICRATSLRMHIWGGAAAGNYVRMGLYDSGADGLPNNLLFDGTPIETTTNSTIETTSCNIQLFPGTYWPAFQCNDGSQSGEGIGSSTSGWEYMFSSGNVFQGMNATTFDYCLIPCVLDATGYSSGFADPFSATARGGANRPMIQMELT